MDSSHIREAWYEEPKNLHRKKKQKRRFRIEARYAGHWTERYKTWGPWSNYGTERARDTALAALNKDSSWEYRAA